MIIDFKIDKNYKAILKKRLKKGIIYKNEYNILISKEYPERELGDKHYYDRLIREKDKRKARPYEIPLIELFALHKNKVDAVLEVGAGLGDFAHKFIERFAPRKYTIYEFSDICKYITKPNSICDFTVYQKSFKDINPTGYDLIIACEVLEHINWDLEFLRRLKTGVYVLFSVPNKPSKGHVRFFPLPESIIHRYSSYMDILEIKTAFWKNNPKWWCVLAKIV